MLRDHYRDRVFIYTYDETFDRRPKAETAGWKKYRYVINGEGACLMANIAMETNDVVPEFRKPIKSFFDDWINARTTYLWIATAREAALIFAKETICAIEGAAMMMRIYNDKSYLPKRANEMIIEKFEKPVKRRSCADI